MNVDGKLVALTGGIGGAKLALGLSRVLAPVQLSIVVNTGDDFRHLGLAISPDIDTLLYTLSDLADPERGWGRRDESWVCMETLRDLGDEAWFSLGDRDLALNLLRTGALAQGATLSEITETLRVRLGVACRVLPMSDDAVRTQLRVDGGWIDFQDYFVRRRCAPVIDAIRYADVERARMAPGVAAALADPQLHAVLVCPSNPMLSIEPMLALPGMRAAIRARGVPVIAVSPIINGAAVKGPTAKLMRELGEAPSAAAVARRYAGLVDVMIVDEADADAELPAGMRRVVAPVVMKTLADRERLARVVLDAAA